MGFGPWEVLIILVVLVIIFGAGRLTNVSGAVGRSVREFRSAVQEEPKPAPAAAPVSTAPPVVCAACETANTATNKFCSSCGAALTPPEPVIAGPVASENTCPSCATPNPAGQVFCGQCGTRLTRAA
jgi:sec-independent protein translocase protein TatA